MSDVFQSGGSLDSDEIAPGAGGDPKHLLLFPVVLARAKLTDPADGSTDTPILLDAPIAREVVIEAPIGSGQVIIVIPPTVDGIVLLEDGSEFELQDGSHLELELS